jgi:hypothetical protein
MNAKPTFIGERFVFGEAEKRPLAGWPPGKIKIVLRPGEFAWGYVRKPDGIAKYAVREKDGWWMPGPLQVKNIKESNQ